jgi:hypothetical protein
MKMKPGRNASLWHTEPHAAQVSPAGRRLHSRSRQVEEIRSRWCAVLTLRLDPGVYLSMESPTDLPVDQPDVADWGPVASSLLLRLHG